MTINAFTRYPFSKYPMNNVTPFTYRDGYTFLQKLEMLWEAIQEVQENESLQSDAINDFVAAVNVTIGELLSQLVGYTIVVDNNKFTASMMDGSTFSAYTDEGVEALINDMQTVLQSFVTTNNAALSLQITNAIVAVNADFDAFKTSSNADRAAFRTQVGLDISAIQTNVSQLSGDFDALELVVGTKVDKSLIKNVKDFGATGNGTTDDTAAIQAALDAAAPGGHVYIPKGTYKTTATLNVGADVRVEGASSSFDAATGMQPVSIRSTHNGVAVSVASGAVVENVAIWGPGYTFANSVGISSVRSVLKLVNVTVYGYAIGFYANQNWYTTLTNVGFYKNDVAMDVDYCYNFTCINLRINADRGAGVSNYWARGILVRNKSMVTLIGGAIESYILAIDLQAAGSIKCFGTYFESSEAGLESRRAVGIRMWNAGSQVLLSGCQIYVTFHNMFVDAANVNSGDSITSLGNTFKGGLPDEAGIVFNWLVDNSAGLRTVLLGDSVTGMNLLAWKYRADTPLKGAVIIDAGGDPPRGGVSGIATGGHIYGGKDYAIIPGSGATYPKFGFYGAREGVGAMFYSTTLGKPVFFNGTAWTDAMGTVLP